MTIEGLYEFFARQRFYRTMGLLPGQDPNELVHLAVLGTYEFLQGEGQNLDETELRKTLSVKGRSAVIDHIRKVRHSKKRYVDQPEDVHLAKFVSLDALLEDGDDLIVSSGDDTLDVVESRLDLWRALELAKQVMTEVEYSTFAAYFLEGKSMKVVSELETVTESCISQRIARGIQRLALRMDGYTVQESLGNMRSP